MHDRYSLAEVQPLAADVLHVSAGRLGASIAAVLGLIGVGLAWRALRRSWRTGAVAALAAGLLAVALGGLVAATASGGLGTGNGLGGAYVGLLVGLLATALGGRALTRPAAARRSAARRSGRATDRSPAA
ncbi:DUF6223 family protein [Streptomyces exfoliatus]|uniref:DUF6223 family protein n=1 Tax=Streptomyces exfoliatus TaxID=1905 RepID=UPI0037ADD09D